MRTITNPCDPLPSGNVGKFLCSIKAIMVLLFFTFLFINTAVAQQPSCNITGPLRAKSNNGGGNDVAIVAEVFNTTPKTVYSWSFKNNSSNAVITSGNGTSTLHVKSGSQTGSFTVVLTVTNPAQDGQESSSCSCSKSVTVIER
ncbi:hypothetical protein LK994_12785 [Ferruginibacter lapsinanis]|uniref:hypothetical protein n=1 Tax=Ferruginibacter lapsinanis TaxID=563172 RepID=UPI001E3D8D11|nr:hypothetical protein [Ferruginibacter lapsinanis]UEG49510.1 hypothetical protein LK994_12785 [Ferruginibacter lapsinanis]